MIEARGDTRRPPARVVVVGAGVAGLAAAWELTGASTPPVTGGASVPSVVVLEAASTVGGKLATAPFAGQPVDVGPDGFLGRRPEAVELCRALGLGDDLAPIGLSGAAVWARGRRRPLPEGLYLGLPTRVLPVARSGILSPLGVLRLAEDVVAPRPDRRGPLGDRAVGPLVARKLGNQVVDRLVDPMLGGIHAGGVADASAAAVMPALLQASQRGGSFLRSLRRLSKAAPAVPGGGAPAPADDPAPAPAFWTLRSGPATLADRLRQVLEARGADVRTGCRVDALERAGQGWVLRAAGGTLAADAVVLALPAGATAALLAPHDPDAAALLRAVDYASLAVVTMLVAEDALPSDLYGTGLLVPRASALDDLDDDGSGAGAACLVTAVTYLWAKWPHLARQGRLLLRASVGRYGDERIASLDDAQLVARVTRELATLLDLGAPPIESLVTRWPQALPQYKVHHMLRVTGVEAAAKRLGNLSVAGAAYRGVGIPACVASGRAAARIVLEQLGRSRAPGPEESPVAP